MFSYTSFPNTLQTAEVRNQSGQSLLSIAAQHDFEELALFLLTYWKECDKERWDLASGELSIEAKTFKTNPNSRDLKGWTCVCIAGKDSLSSPLDHFPSYTLDFASTVYFDPY